MSESRQKSTVFVGGLDNQVTAHTLHEAFIPFGEIVDVSLPKPELYAFTIKYSPASGMLIGRLANHRQIRTAALAMSSLSCQVMLKKP